MNSMVSRSLASLGIIAALSGIAHADTVTYAYSGAAVAIPDTTPAGINFDIAVADNFSLSQFTSVSVTFGNAPAHSWGADIIAKLTHVPSGRTITLFSRIGCGVTSDIGDSSDLGGTYTFSNVLPVTGATRLIDSASTLASTTVITNGTYRPTTNLFNGVTGTTFTGETITNLNTTFDGLANVSGTWRLNVSDNAGGDTGTLSGFSFTVVTPPVVVPEASTLMLSVFGATISGMVVIRRKRKALIA